MSKERAFGIFLIFTALMFGAACGSPLFDHTTKPKPNGNDLDKAVSDRAVTKSTAAGATGRSSSQSDAHPPSDCPQEFQTNGDYCFDLRFSEPPTYQSSTKTFTADLTIWNRQTSQWAQSQGLPSVSFQCAVVCCDARPLVIETIASGRFRIRDIEFHAEGIFDVLVAIRLEQGEILKGVMTLDVGR